MAPDPDVPKWVWAGEEQSYFELKTWEKLLGPQWELIHNVDTGVGIVSLVSRDTDHALSGRNCFDLVHKLNRAFFLGAANAPPDDDNPTVDGPPESTPGANAPPAE